MSVTYPKRWMPKDPSKIQLFTIGTANGVKVSAALEELGLEYEVHLVNIIQGDQFDHEYISLINPNSKIPSLVDPEGPDGQPLVIMESNAILLYLTEKMQTLMPENFHQRWETIQWLEFQGTNIGPTIGQFGHFNQLSEDKAGTEYSLKRYTKEGRRLLQILDKRLTENMYLAGDKFSIADIATAPWMVQLEFYGGQEVMGFNECEHLVQWTARCLSRPAMQRGLQVGRG